MRDSLGALLAQAYADVLSDYGVAVTESVPAARQAATVPPRCHLPDETRAHWESHVKEHLHHSERAYVVAAVQSHR